MLKGGVGGEDGVVRLNNGGGGLRSRVDAELKLALLAVVDGEALHEESTETRTGTTTERVEDEETLETNTVVGDTADLVKDALNELLADGVVTTGVVVGGILLASDHELGVEKVAVGASADLIDDIGLEIAVDGARDVLALTCRHGMVRDVVGGGVSSPLPWNIWCQRRTSLREESAEALVGGLGLALFGEVTIRL